MEQSNSFTIPNNLPLQATQPELKGSDISAEEYREYIWNGRDLAYRINSPKTLYVGKTTHRVVDAAGIVHCVPTVGERGCVLRWRNRAGYPEVQF